MLPELLPSAIFSFFLVFGRLGAAFMVLPGIGEAYISPRFRLAIALAMSFAILPFVEETLPALPDGLPETTVLLLGEITIGLFMGLTIKLAVTALHVAGTIMSFQSSLGFAQFFDPTQQVQSAILSTFLTLFGLMVIFVGDLHLLMLRAAFDSYAVFPPGAMPAIDGLAETATRFVADSFSLGVRIAAPFTVYALILYLGMGVMNRLMPQMQVFFIVMPLNIMLGMLVFMITMGASLALFADYFGGAVNTFIPGS